MKQLLTLGLLLAAASSAPAAIVWVGGAGTNFYTTANWDFSGSSVTAAGFTAGASINDNLVMSNASGISLNGNLTIGDGFSFTLTNSSVVSTGSEGFNGGASNGSTVTINLNGSSSLSVQFITNGTFANVSNGSTLTLRGAGDPLNSSVGVSRVTLAPGGSLVFNGAGEYSEHAAEIFHSVTGNTLATTPSDFNPASGSTITAIAPIPEPSVAIFGGLGLIGLLRRRR